MAINHNSFNGGRMPRNYEVYITEIRIYKVEVEAELDEQAEAIANNLWHNRSSDVELLSREVTAVQIKDKREVYEA